MKAGSDRFSGGSVEPDAYWPSFVSSWPEAPMEVEGLKGWISRGDRGWVIFMTAERDVLIPMHHHGAQWGVVLGGEMELTIADEKRVYRRGEAHYIPEGVDHEALLRAGWRGLYVFARTPKPGFARGES